MAHEYLTLERLYHLQDKKINKKPYFSKKLGFAAGGEMSLVTTQGGLLLHNFSGMRGICGLDFGRDLGYL
jgi:hypothetical protein